LTNNREKYFIFNKNERAEGLEKVVTEDEFRESLMTTIDMRLKQVFGKTATMIIYNYLQTALSLQQEEIPEKLQVFTDGLNNFLSSGAMVVERVILESVYCKFGHEFQTKEGYRLPDYIDELKAELKGSQRTSRK